MNQIKILGAVHTFMGTAALVYAAILLSYLSGGPNEIRAIIIYSILGILFFVSGIVFVVLPTQNYEYKE